MNRGAEARLDALLAELTEYWPLPGGAVAVVDTKGVVFSRVFGGSAVDIGIPLAQDALFEIGSISKVMTAMVVHHLVDDGLFGLETRITDLLPWCDLGPGEPVTVRHLLQHSSGIISGADAVPDQVAQAWSLRDRTRRAAPGDFFHYSNLGYILLGLGASRAAGRPLSELVRERVLDPFGMTASIAEVTNDDRARVAPGSIPVRQDRPWLPGDPLEVAPWLEVDGADGNVAASIDDVGRFVRGLLGRGSLDGAEVFSAAAFTRMITDTGPGGEETLALEGIASSESSNYGLGINVERSSDHTVLTHGGGMVGYASFVLADLDAGLGVAVLTNANGDSPIAEVIARSAASFWTRTTAPAGLNPFAWRVDGVPASRPRTVPRALLGRFVATDEAGIEVSIEIDTVADDASETSLGLVITCDGITAPLLWTWGGRIATGHPRFRSLAFDADPDGGELAWGGLIFRAVPVAATSTVHPEYVGSYRSYSPWFAQFRIVDRAGTLVLIAAGGVEAPGEDVPLVEIGTGNFRMGTDPRLPETLSFGPVVDGRVAYVDRDGCRYSRSFTD